MLMHKTIVICDSCDEKTVIDYAGSKSIFGRSALGDNPLPDWSEVKAGICVLPARRHTRSS